MRIQTNVNKAQAIGLASLIDVVFILLLFFMLSSQFTRQRALPVEIIVDAGGQAADSETELVVLQLVDEKRAILNGSEEIQLQQLNTHYIMHEASRLGSTVVIDADEKVSIQSVISVSDSLALLGITKIVMRALQ